MIPLFLSDLEFLEDVVFSTEKEINVLLNALSILG
jgi:hypothetical protein